MVGTAIVTGASRGIGLAVAGHLLGAGWRVLTLSRSACPLEGVTHIPVDLSDPEGDEAVAEALGQALPPGRSRVTLIHNAALLQPGPMTTLSPAALRRALEVNLVAPLRLNAMVLDRMSPGSSVLYVGSTLSEKGIPGAAAYVISKHALAGAMRALCQDLAGTGIHTACVCPGLTRTEMLDARTAGDPDRLAELAAVSTFGRLIAPEEIAAAVLFAAENPVINGSMFHVNLGQVER